MNKNKNIPRLRFLEFKDSPEWTIKKLGELGDIITGNTPATNNSLNYNGNNLFVSPADISETRYVITTKTTLSELGFKETRQVQPNSILFVCIGSTIGKVAQNKFICATNQQINSIVPFDKIANDFIYSALEKDASKIALLAGNHAVPIINKTSFSAIELNIPLLPEQEKIAECLSSVDELITAQTDKIAALKEHKKGLMQKLFPQDGETTPCYRFHEFRNSPPWQEDTLGNIAQIVRGGSPRPIENYLTSDTSGLNWLKIGDIDKNAKYVIGTQEKVLPTALSKTRVVSSGDLILSNSMSFGRPYILKIEACIHDGWIAITKIRHGVMVDYLYYLISTSSSQKYFLNNAAGSGVLNLNADIIKLLPLTIPEPKEQEKIAECLSSIDELISLHTEKLSAIKEHKKGLMQQLFPAIGEE